METRIKSHASNCGAAKFEWQYRPYIVPERVRNIGAPGVSVHLKKLRTLCHMP
ncbi:hypothetical protein LMG29542_02038 [Paraburkholderia humisilvae]|uniref:Uncharacterized protein n=1 Tax=Paraburkholderia humisilvae TaxID=627669 RepID=A0A6J5DGV7_9BURK|nr:hypothetical protein LMG29542_02038 [Paraburkholderia humisilvae]